MANTGKIGRRVIDGLGGNEIRGLARTAISVDELAGYEYVKTRIADLDDPSSLKSALQGVDVRHVVFDNLLIQLDTLRQGRFYFPADGAVITPIEARDLAAVAVRDLLASKPYGGVLKLAPRLSAATGKSLELVNDVSPSWEPG